MSGELIAASARNYDKKHILSLGKVVINKTVESSNCPKIFQKIYKNQSKE